jgi:SAM-dependent methyltransferase
MSHTSQVNFVRSLKEQFSEKFQNIKMLEVGSLNINGTIRDFFEDCEYLGYDVGAGRCVDVVYDGLNFNEGDNTLDTAGSCNCFEHNPNWVSNFRDMHRMLKPGGLLFISVPTTGNPVHGTSGDKPEDSPLTISKGWEYYKNLTVEDFTENFDLESMFSSHNFRIIHEPHHDLFFFGFKK